MVKGYLMDLRQPQAPVGTAGDVSGDGRGRGNASPGRGRTSPGSGRGHASPQRGGRGHVDTVAVRGRGEVANPAPAHAAPDLHLNINDNEQFTANNNTARARFRRAVRWMSTEDNRFFLWCSYFLAIVAVYSSVMAPLKCSFMIKDLSNWFLIPIEVIFAIDVTRQWLCVLGDNQATNPLLLLWNLSSPRRALETLAIIPWGYLFQWKYGMWFKIVRALRVKDFFEILEKCQVLDYSFIRFLKLMSIQMYCAHIAGCLFYHLATTIDGLPKADGTWMSHIQLGGNDLTQLGTPQKYITSVYFAIVTLSTVGYGDIYAVNVQEMLVVIGLIIFSLIVWSYLGVNLSNLFVRRSRARIIRDKMDKVEKHLRDINATEEQAKQIRDHMVIKYNDDYDKRFLECVPPSIRTKISRAFNESIIKKVSLFHGCSAEFIKYLACEVREDFYAPGYILFEEGIIVNQLYILFSGDLEQLKGGNEIPQHILPTRIFGLESLLFNDAHPYTLRACETSKILTLNKDYFMDALETYLLDAAIFMENLKLGRSPNFVARLTNSEFGVRMQKDDIEKASLLNHAVFVGNFYKVKALVRSGVNVNSMDYNKRSPLHVAATKGNIEITNFLIEERAHVNITDCNGTTPLLEAIKNGHDGIAEILIPLGASFGIQYVGEYICKVVSDNDLPLLKRLLKYNMDPNARNYDGQTPLHIAAAKGKFAIAKALLAAGAATNIEDSWGHRALDEARNGKHTKMIEMLSTIE